MSVQIRCQGAGTTREVAPSPPTRDGGEWGVNSQRLFETPGSLASALSGGAPIRAEEEREGLRMSTWSLLLIACAPASALHASSLRATPQRTRARSPMMPIGVPKVRPCTKTTPPPARRAGP